MNLDYPRTLLGIVEQAVIAGWRVEIHRGSERGMTCTLIPHSSTGRALVAYVRWRAGVDGRWRLHTAVVRDLVAVRSDTVTLAAIRDLLRAHRIGGPA